VSTPVAFKNPEVESVVTGLLQKALWYAVFSVQFSGNGLLKTENLDFAKVQF